MENRYYQVPFEFNCKLNKLTLASDRPQLTPADIAKLKEAPGRCWAAAPSRPACPGYAVFSAISE
jgi:hypothetical protein